MGSKISELVESDPANTQVWEQAHPGQLPYGN